MNIFDFFKRSKPALETLNKSNGLVLGNSTVHPNHAGVLRDLAAGLNRTMQRSYDSAMTNGLNQDFRTTIGSANAEILTSAWISRGRARTLVKDFGTAKAIQRTMQNGVVGHDPFRLKMQVGKYVDGKFQTDSEINRMIEEEWRIAGRKENFSVRKNMSRMEGYRIVEASAFRDGGILARHWRGYPNNRYGYAIDLLEIDRLQESYMGRAAGTNNEIRFSIEVDQWQAPVAYWLLTRHPGDVFGYNSAKTGTDASQWRERVDAENIIHFNNLRDRAEQDIGFTELDAVIQSLHRDRQYDISLVYAAIASACKPFWIKQEFPTGMQYTPEAFEQWMNSVRGPLGVDGTGGAGTGGAAFDPVAAQRGVGIRTNTFSPATTEIMDYGRSLEQVDPKFPIEAASEFKKDNMRAAAVGVGVSYQAATGDFQNLGFSASRMSEIPQRDWFKVRQEHMIESFVRLHFNEWLKYAILSGRLKLDISRLEEFQNAARFLGRRWQYVNPLQDVQADILSVEAGFQSEQQVQDEREDGQPLEKLYSEFEEAKDLQEAHGLHFGEEEQMPVTAPTKGQPNADATSTDDTERGGSADIPPKKGGKQTIKRHMRRYPVMDLEGDGRNGLPH